MLFSFREHLYKRVPIVLEQEGSKEGGHRAPSCVSRPIPYSKGCGYGAPRCRNVGRMGEAAVLWNICGRLRRTYQGHPSLRNSVGEWEAGKHRSRLLGRIFLQWGTSVHVFWEARRRRSPRNYARAVTTRRRREGVPHRHQDSLEGPVKNPGLCNKTRHTLARRFVCWKIVAGAGIGHESLTRYAPKCSRPRLGAQTNGAPAACNSCPCAPEKRKTPRTRHGVFHSGCGGRNCTCDLQVMRTTTVFTAAKHFRVVFVVWTISCRRRRPCRLVSTPSREIHGVSQ